MNPQVYPPIWERLPCKIARLMTESFQKSERFSWIPGIFHFSPEDVSALFDLPDTRFGMRIYMGYHGSSTGYRAHRAIAVPTMKTLNGEIHTDLIGIEDNGQMRTIIRELSFPCPDMCNNIADVASPLFSYEGAQPELKRLEACKENDTCSLALPAVRRFQADPTFTEKQFPGVFTFNYDDTRNLFEVASDFGFRVYLAHDPGFEDYRQFSLYAVRTRLNEDLMIYEDVIFEKEIVMCKAETSPLRAGGRNDFTSPLFFYEGNQSDDKRINTCKDYFPVPHHVD